MMTIGLILLAMMLFSGCGQEMREYELDGGNFDSKTLRMIQDDTGIILPKSARGLRFYYKPPIDPAYLAKIEISREAKERMRETISSIESKDIKINGSLEKRVSWWIPAGVKVLADVQTVLDSGPYLHAVLTEEGDDVILYLEWVTY